jgi:hypothetical protein
MLQAKAETAAKDYRGGRFGALACRQRCQTAAEDVDRFINQTLLIEAWAADLAKYSRAGSASVFVFAHEPILIFKACLIEEPWLGKLVLLSTATHAECNRH